MKPLIAFAICMLAFSGAFAQNKGTGKKAEKMPNINVLPQRDKKIRKSAIGGFFTDIRRRPIKGVKAFIYLPDSTIGASGYTDVTGYFETNSVLPGLYDLKIIYPASQGSIRITGVPVKSGTITDISFFKSLAPETDTIFSYSVIEPKPIVKEKKK